MSRPEDGSPAKNEFSGDDNFDVGKPGSRKFVLELRVAPKLLSVCRTTLFVVTEEVFCFAWNKLSYYNHQIQPSRGVLENG